MITFNLFAVTSFDLLLNKILEWRKKYTRSNAGIQWQNIRFDTPYLKEPIQFDMNILPKEQFIPYMTKHLQFIGDNVDDSDRHKFSLLEYERFRRVVDYMRTTTYDDKKLATGRKTFYNWFTQYDKRSNSNLVETFPELKEFYDSCKS